MHALPVNGSAPPPWCGGPVLAIYPLPPPPGRYRPAPVKGSEASPPDKELPPPGTYRDAPASKENESNTYIQLQMEALNMGLANM